MKKRYAFGELHIGSQAWQAKPKSTKKLNKRRMEKGEAKTITNDELRMTNLLAGESCKLEVTKGARISNCELRKAERKKQLQIKNYE